MTKQDYIADNALSDNPIIELEDGLGSVEVPSDYMRRIEYNAGKYAEGTEESNTPVIRVHADSTRDDGRVSVALETSIESEETGFNAGMSLILEPGDVDRLLKVLVDTSYGLTHEYNNDGDGDTSISVVNRIRSALRGGSG